MQLRAGRRRWSRQNLTQMRDYDSALEKLRGVKYMRVGSSKTAHYSYADVVEIGTTPGSCLASKGRASGASRTTVRRSMCVVAMTNLLLQDPTL